MTQDKKTPLSYLNNNDKRTIAMHLDPSYKWKDLADSLGCHNLHIKWIQSKTENGSPTFELLEYLEKEVLCNVEDLKKHLYDLGILSVFKYLEDNYPRIRKSYEDSQMIASKTFPMRNKQDLISLDNPRIQSSQVPIQVSPYKKCARNNRIFTTYTTKNLHLVHEIMTCLHNNEFAVSDHQREQNLVKNDYLAWIHSRFKSADSVLVFITPEYFKKVDVKGLSVCSPDDPYLGSRYAFKLMKMEMDEAIGLEGNDLEMGENCGENLDGMGTEENENGEGGNGNGEGKNGENVDCVWLKENGNLGKENGENEVTSGKNMGRMKGEKSFINTLIKSFVKRRQKSGGLRNDGTNKSKVKSNKINTYSRKFIGVILMESFVNHDFNSDLSLKEKLRPRIPKWITPLYSWRADYQNLLYYLICPQDVMQSFCKNNLGSCNNDNNSNDNNNDKINDANDINNNDNNDYAACKRITKDDNDVSTYQMNTQNEDVDSINYGDKSSNSNVTSDSNYNSNVTTENSYGAICNTNFNIGGINEGANGVHCEGGGEIMNGGGDEIIIADGGGMIGGNCSGDAGAASKSGRGGMNYGGRSVNIGNSFINISNQGNKQFKRPFSLVKNGYDVNGNDGVMNGDGDGVMKRGSGNKGGNGMNGSGNFTDINNNNIADRNQRVTKIEDSSIIYESLNTRRSVYPSKKVERVGKH